MEFLKQDLLNLASFVRTKDEGRLLEAVRTRLRPSNAVAVLHAVLVDGSEFGGLRNLASLLREAREAVLSLARVRPREYWVIEALVNFGHESVRILLLDIVNAESLLSPEVKRAASALAWFGDIRLAGVLATSARSPSPPELRREAAELWWHLCVHSHLGDQNLHLLQECADQETDPEVQDALRRACRLQGDTPRLLEIHTKGIDEIAERALIDPGGAFRRAFVNSVAGDMVSKESFRDALLADGKTPLVRLFVSFRFNPDSDLSGSDLTIEEKERALGLLEQAAEQSEGVLQEALRTRSLQWKIGLDDATGKGYYDLLPKGNQWWEAWQAACERGAQAMHGTVLLASRGETTLTNGRTPDIVVSGDTLRRGKGGRILYAPVIIDAKSYLYIEPFWPQYYVDFCDTLEIWWLGIEPHRQEVSQTALDKHLLNDALFIAIADLVATGKSIWDRQDPLVHPDDVEIVRRLLNACGVRAEEIRIVDESWAARGYADPVVQSVIFASAPTRLRQLYDNLRKKAEEYEVSGQGSLFIVNSHGPRPPYQVNLAQGSCTCKYYQGDTGTIHRRCVHMFAAERMVPDQAVDLRLKALSSELALLRLRLQKRRIRSASEVIADLRGRGRLVEAERMQRILDEVDVTVRNSKQAHRERVSILTAFNGF